MKTRPRPTPLDLPRQAIYQKNYTAILCADGRVLPIEERLGRRLLRTLEPASPEGRELLRRGWVRLRTAEGKPIEGGSLERVYAQMRRDAAERLAERPEDSSWCAHYRSILSGIESWERSLLPDTTDH